MPCDTQRIYQPVKEPKKDKPKQKPKPKVQLKKIVVAKAKSAGWLLKPASNTASGRWNLVAYKQYSQDKMKIQILNQGVIKVIVDGKISAPNHVSAENFLRLIHEAHGGEVIVQHKHGAAMHTHEHEHYHA